MLRRQRKRESLHLTESRANKKRQKETGHSTLKWPLCWCAAVQGLRQEKTQADSQAIASPPLLNCFEKQIFTATINWDAGMLHGHGMRFRTAAQKPQKFPFGSFGLAILNISLAHWCTAMGWGLLFFTFLNHSWWMFGDNLKSCILISGQPGSLILKNERKHWKNLCH